MTEKSFNHIGEFVKTHRKKVGLSQTQLSEILGYQNGQFISNVERGLCSVPLKHAPVLREVLKVKAHELTRALLMDLEDTVHKHIPPEKGEHRYQVAGRPS